MDLNNGLQDAYWTLLTAAGAFALKFIKDMSKALQQLSKDFAVILNKMENQQKVMDDHKRDLDSHEDRIHALEIKSPQARRRKNERD